MNYLKHYIKLVKRKSTAAITEKHHIFPTSIFGSNENIVVLSIREHFVAHKLLYMIYKKRYGNKDWRTKKMLHAARMMIYGFNRNQRITVSSFWYAKFREHNSIRSRGKNNPACQPGIGKKISDAKRGVPRPDIKGKSYFGASEESIKNGIEKMRQTKTGMKINYPTNRNSPPCTPEKAQKISESKVFIDQRFKEMSEDEFLKWMSDKNLYRKDGRPNPNITRILKLRNIPNERYYN
jgi:hypothetical protein